MATFSISDSSSFLCKISPSLRSAAVDKSAYVNPERCHASRALFLSFSFVAILIFLNNCKPPPHHITSPRVHGGKRSTPRLVLTRPEESIARLLTPLLSRSLAGIPVSPGQFRANTFYLRSRTSPHDFYLLLQEHTGRQFLLLLLRKLRFKLR